MANSTVVLKAKLDATNDLLKKEKVGVTIYIRRDGFSLRAVLPSKDPKNKQNSQQYVGINLKAEIGNHKEAVRLARKLGLEKKSGLFDWKNWQVTEEEKIEVDKESRKVRDVIRKFEEDFWSQEDKDRNNPSNMAGWKQIEHYLKMMEGHKILTTQNIIELGNTIPKASKKKSDFSKYFLRLSKFAEIPNIKKLQAWATDTQQAYKKESKKRVRDRLTDEEYLKFIRELRNDVHRVQNRKWGWSLAAQFLFGARTSEIWSIKPYEKDGQILAEILTVEKNEQPTQWRITPALKQEWARELNILEVDKVHSIDEITDYDAAFLKSHNRLYTKWIAEMTNKSFQAYDLRHAYGYRTANMNINTDTASKWMGHSEAVHSSTYKKGYDEGDVIASMKELLRNGGNN